MSILPLASFIEIERKTEPKTFLAFQFPTYQVIKTNNTCQLELLVTAGPLVGGGGVGVQYSTLNKSLIDFKNMT